MYASYHYHENLKNVLIKDAWTITHDPFHLKWGRKDLDVDLAAEK
ncbi:MAG: element excision factor XisH family protein [Nostoc sp.]